MDWLFGYGGSMVVLVLYFTATMFIGLVAWRYFPQSDPEGYILGGRGMGWFVAAFTLMATQYSALTFLGFPGTMYRTGLGGYVAVTGMYIGVSALYWVLFAARTWKLGRAFGHMTPADTFAHFYGQKRVGYLLAALLIATLIPYIQAQIMGISYLLQVATGDRVSFQLGTTVVYSLMIFYVFMGGLRAVAWTDTMQGLLLLGGIVLGALMVSYAAAGGPVSAFNKVLEAQPELLTLPGPSEAWPWAYLLSWVIPVGLGWPMQPQMWLKIAHSQERDLYSPLAGLGHDLVSHCHGRCFSHRHVRASGPARTHRADSHGHHYDYPVARVFSAHRWRPHCGSGSCRHDVHGIESDSQHRCLLREGFSGSVVS